MLVIGGRYGSIDATPNKSVTNLEYTSARHKRIPIYVFIDPQVLALLPLWKRNPAADFSGQVDSPRLFEFIEHVRTIDSVWMSEFRSARDITDALRTQFAFQQQTGLRLQRQTLSLADQDWFDTLRGEALRVALDRPRAWEYLLFASALRDGVARHRRLARTHALKIPIGFGEDVQDPLGLCCNFRAATSGWTTFGKHRTGSPIMPSDNPFKWRQFEPALILQCVRWYLRYALSYRDLEDMMRERGLCVDHTTIYRWVQRYAPEIDKRCRPFLRRTNDSYRIDETYVRVAGAWTYLYRGVDSNGDTLDFLLRATRDRKAAIAFFRKTLGAAHTTPPRVVTVDKNPAYPVAFEAVRHEGLVRPRSNLRQCKYLNNIIEQDHRFIKRRTRPMLGFKRFTTAWRTLRGIEIMHALRKGQARWMAKGDVVGQTQLIHKVFGLAA